MIKILFILAITFGISQAKILDAKQLFNKEIINIKKEDISSTISFYGNTEIDESKIFDINLRYDGFIESLKVKNSFQEIKKGEILFTVYSEDMLSIKEEITLSKRINKSMYKSSINKLKRFKLKTNDFNKKGLIKFKSPSNGIILDKKINNLSYVKKGNNMFRIADITKILIIGELYEKDLKKVKLGDAAIILINDSKYEGKINEIYPYVNKENKTIKVKIELDNNKKEIYPNMTAKIHVIQKHKEIYTLPKTAVINKGSKFFILKASNKTDFEPIEVKVNRITENKYQIISDDINQETKVINNSLFLFDSEALTNGLYDTEDEEW